MRKTVDADNTMVFGTRKGLRLDSRKGPPPFLAFLSPLVVGPCGLAGRDERRRRRRRKGARKPLPKGGFSSFVGKFPLAPADAFALAYDKYSKLCLVRRICGWFLGFGAGIEPKNKEILVAGGLLDLTLEFAPSDSPPFARWRQSSWSKVKRGASKSAKGKSDRMGRFSRGFEPISSSSWMRPLTEDSTIGRRAEGGTRHSNRRNPSKPPTDLAEEPNLICP